MLLAVATPIPQTLQVWPYTSNALGIVRSLQSASRVVFCPGLGSQHRLSQAEVIALTVYCKCPETLCSSGTLQQLIQHQLMPSSTLQLRVSDTNTDHEAPTEVLWHCPPTQTIRHQLGTLALSTHLRLSGTLHPPRPSGTLHQLGPSGINSDHQALSTKSDHLAQTQTVKALSTNSDHQAPTQAIMQSRRYPALPWDSPPTLLTQRVGGDLGEDTLSS